MLCALTLISCSGIYFSFLKKPVKLLFHVSNLKCIQKSISCYWHYCCFYVTLPIHRAVLLTVLPRVELLGCRLNTLISLTERSAHVKGVQAQPPFLVKVMGHDREIKGLYELRMWENVWWSSRGGVRRGVIERSRGGAVDSSMKGKQSYCCPK